MAKAGNRTSTEQLLCEAKKFLANFLGSPLAAEEMFREALATGRVQWRCRLVRGGAADSDLWRSRWPSCCPAVNFEESKARALVGHSPSGVPIYGPWHLGIIVSRADVRALLPEEPSGRGRGYQADRVTRALNQLETEGWKLRDHTPADLRDLALKRITGAGRGCHSVAPDGEPSDPAAPGEVKPALRIRRPAGAAETLRPT
jgi:hypothetical protein